jgi:protein CpxP
MNEQQNGVNDSPNSRKWFRRRTIMGALAATAGIFGVSLWSRAQFGREWRCGGARHRMDQEAVADRLSHMTDHILSHVDATPEQKAKVAAITQAAVKDLAPQLEKHRAARRRALDLLTQPTIDRGAVEQFRTDEMQLAESVSRRLAQALTDSAEVLTPEQRVALAERWKSRWNKLSP